MYNLLSVPVKEDVLSNARSKKKYELFKITRTCSIIIIVPIFL